MTTDDRAHDDHDDDRVEELANLSADDDPEFAARVGRAIERRRLAGHGLEFGWFAPLVLLREFLAMAWGLTTGGSTPKEDRR